MVKENTQTQAQHVFNQRQNDIDRLIKNLQTKIGKLESRLDEEPDNWGIVGDLGAIRTELRELLNEN